VRRNLVQFNVTECQNHPADVVAVDGTDERLSPEMFQIHNFNFQQRVRRHQLTRAQKMAQPKYAARQQGVDQLVELKADFCFRAIMNGLLAFCGTTGFLC